MFECTDLLAKSFCTDLTDLSLATLERLKRFSAHSTSFQLLLSCHGDRLLRGRRSSREITYGYGCHDIARRSCFHERIERYFSTFCFAKCTGRIVPTRPVHKYQNIFKLIHPCIAVWASLTSPAFPSCFHDMPLVFEIDPGLITLVYRLHACRYGTLPR